MANYIVSGCPRSGTSMTMQIFSHADLPIAKDDKRAADKDNLHGYFEIDDIVQKIKDYPDLAEKIKKQITEREDRGICFLSNTVIF